MPTPTPAHSGIDCPACGASAESGLAVAMASDEGSDFSYHACCFTIWQGSIHDRGSEIPPDEVIALVMGRVPDLPSNLAHREPWERRSGLAIWWVASSEDATSTSPGGPASSDDQPLSSVVRSDLPRSASEPVR